MRPNNVSFKLGLVVLALVGLVSLSVALPPPTTPQAAASAATNEKLAKLDLLIKLVPLALKKEQYPSLLDGIEEARQIQRDTLKEEDTVLANLDPIVTDTINNAIQKGIYPPKAVFDNAENALNAMDAKRSLARSNMILAIYKEVKKDFNAGQIKVMAGSFDPSFIAPGQKPEDVNEDMRVEFYISRVFMDPLTYDLLVEMSKYAS